MREIIRKLITETIFFEYELPCSKRKFNKTKFSNQNDHCYSAQKAEDLVTIIYNAIIEYSFNEQDINRNDYEKLHFRALKTKIRYDEDASKKTKKKYGFYGEVLLYAILNVIYGTDLLISRGYFYNPLEKSEAKGYDSYHIIEKNNELELWFGEAKFYENYKKAVISIMNNLEKAISDEYLNTNILAITNQRANLNIKGTKLEEIILKWEENPYINITEELKENKMKLVYPILVICKKPLSDYDESINTIVNYINNDCEDKTLNLSIKLSIFFMILPIEKVGDIKEEVIKWIELKKPLIS